MEVKEMKCFKQVHNYDLNTMFKCTVNLYQLDKNIIHYIHMDILNNRLIYVQHKLLKCSNKWNERQYTFVYIHTHVHICIRHSSSIIKCNFEHISCKILLHTRLKINHI